MADPVKIPPPVTIGTGSNIGKCYDVDGEVVPCPEVDVVTTTPPTPTKTAMDEAMDLELAILSTIQSRLNQIHAVWKDNYLPCELNTLSIVCSKPKQTTNIALVAGAAAAETTRQYAAAGNAIREQMLEACFTPDCNFDNRLAVAKARSESWKIQGALRFDEIRVDMENTIRLNDRISMISPGRNGVVAAANSLAAVAKLYQEQAELAAAAKSGDRYAQGRGIEMLKGLSSMGKSLQGIFNSAGGNTAQQNFRQAEIAQQEFSASGSVIAPPMSLLGGMDNMNGADLPADFLTGTDGLYSPEALTIPTNTGSDFMFE